MTEAWRHLKLGDLLIDANAITKNTLDAALVEQKISRMRLGEVLIKNGWLTERQLAEALSRQLKLPLVSLARYRPSSEAIRIIPEAVAQRLEIVPLAILESGKIAIAMSDPLNVLAVDELKMITNTEFDINIATASDVRRALASFYKVQSSLDDAMDEVGIDLNASMGPGGAQDLAGVGADDAPVVRLVNSVLEQAVKEGASDIHVEAFEKISKVRLRIDGALYESFEFPKNLHPAVVSRMKILSGMDISERRRPQDGRIMIKIGQKRIDLRVSCLPAVFGEKMVMRLLDNSSTKVGLEKLGLYPEDVETLKKAVAAPYGIFLVTGPTGSGKSTTLYSLLEVINTPDVNIVTVEDPVEYTVAGINQVQANEKTGNTFTAILRAILRQDPDKIMVGEIRDVETAELAIRAALTGHLVLSTLHTNDAPSSIIRMVDMGIQPFLIASSVVAVVAQRLVRRLCTHCKTPIIIPDNYADTYHIPRGTQIYASVGCDECRGTGYQGRTNVMEIMVINEELRLLINKNAPVNEIRDAALRNGMNTLAMSAMRKVAEGITSIEQMLAITMDH